MYIAVKGGEAAIEASRQLLASARRGDPAVRELEVVQIREQLGLLVDRVMAEASLYDPELAALALQQARGDAVEAIFLLRAYRTTLPRVAATEPIDTQRMRANLDTLRAELPAEAADEWFTADLAAQAAALANAQADAIEAQLAPTLTTAHRTMVKA